MDRKKVKTAETAVLSGKIKDIKKYLQFIIETKIKGERK